MMEKRVDEKCQKSISRVRGAGVRIPADGADCKYRRDGFLRELYLRIGSPRHCCNSTIGTVSRGAGNRQDLGQSFTDGKPRETINARFNEV